MLQNALDVTSFYTVLSDFFCMNTEITGFTQDVICTASGNSITVVKCSQVLSLSPLLVAFCYVEKQIPC